MLKTPSWSLEREGVSNKRTIAADSCRREIQRRTGLAMGNSRKNRPCCKCTYRAGIFKESMGLGTEEEEGYRTGPPGYIGWRNSFLGIDSGAPYTFKNTDSGRANERKREWVCGGGGVFWPGIRYVMGGGGWIIRSQKYAGVPIRTFQSI